MNKENWTDMVIDMSKLQECQKTIKDILDTVNDFSHLDFPKSLYCAYMSLDDAIKFYKLFTGMIDAKKISPKKENPLFVRYK